MIDWLLKQKTDRLVYLFFSPWLLMAILPLTSVYGNWNKIESFAFLIFGLQISFSYIMITYIVRKLILINDSQFSNSNLTGFLIHSWLNLSIFILNSYEIINSQAGIFFLLIPTLLISELFRTSRISCLIVGLESQRKVTLFESTCTFYLITNPIVGIWNLHKRLKKNILLSL